MAVKNEINDFIQLIENFSLHPPFATELTPCDKLIESIEKITKNILSTRSQKIEEGLLRISQNLQVLKNPSYSGFVPLNESSIPHWEQQLYACIQKAKIKQKAIQTHLETISYIFEAFFKNTYANNYLYCDQLNQRLITCFQMQTHPLSITESCFITLETFFQQYASHQAIEMIPLKTLTQNCTEKEGEAFLNQLLYAIHYHEFQYDHADSVQPLILQIFAESVSQHSLSIFLRTLSFSDQVHLINQVSVWYREGSYFILKTLKKLALEMNTYGSEQLQALIQGLTRKYYNLNLFSSELLKRRWLAIGDLQQILNQLEETFLSEIQRLHSCLRVLPQILIEAPMKELEIQIQQRSTEEHANLKLNAQEEQQSIQERFQKYQHANYTIEEIEKLARLFGLYGHAKSLTPINNLTYPEALTDTLELISKQKAAPSGLIGREVGASMINFISSLFEHLESLNRSFDEYEKGVQKIIYALPTSGKELSKLPWVESIIEGLKLFHSLRAEKLTQDIFKEHPIFIFDQSEDRLFEKNHQYLKELMAQEGCKIFHLDTESILKCAHKLHLEKLIDTTNRGILGFGGARNAVYFLAPVLDQFYRIGISSLDQMLLASEKQWRDLFAIFVMGKFNGELKTQDSIVHMGDDDLWIPESNVLVEGLHALNKGSLYFLLEGSAIGKNTKHVFVNYSLSHLLDNNLLGVFHPVNVKRGDLITPSKWSSIPFSTGMAGTLSKPRFCWNVPFGGEEMCAIMEEIISTTFRQPTEHLAGSRYPSATATHPLMGLDRHFDRAIPYSFQISIFQSLIHPAMREIRHPKAIFSLSDNWEALSNPENRQRMQRRFWMDIENLLEFDVSRCKNKLIECFHEDIQRLINNTVESSVQEYQRTHHLTAQELDNLKLLGAVFLKYQEDARHFIEFGKRVIRILKESVACQDQSWIQSCLDQEIDFAEAIHQAKEEMETKIEKSIRDLPLTFSLELLFLSVGAAEFNSEVKKLLENAL